MKKRKFSCFKADNYIFGFILCLMAALFIFATSAPAEAACSTNKLRAIPTNPATDGPWPVGSKVVTISGLSSVVWYPAVPGSQAGKAKDSYCMKDYITVNGTREEHTWPINSYRDLPLDASYGKYPLIVMVHGTGAIKYAHHVLATHWASRGFVVISADNPKIYLTDALANPLGILRADQQGDTKKIISAVKYTTGSLAFLRGKVDTARIGLAGHSAGGFAVSKLNSVSGVQVIIPMASPAKVSYSLYTKSVMLMGGMLDNAAKWSLMQSAYNLTTVGKKRLVGIPNAGHMVFTNLCESVAKAGEYGFDLSGLEAIANDGCGSSYINQKLGWEIINYASTAVFEETLQCNSTSAASVASIAGKYSGVYYK